LSTSDAAAPSGGGKQCLAPDVLLEQLHACIDLRQADGQGLAVLVIDCGVIGQVDAAWGYEIGDAVRRRIGAGLCADALRPGDFVGELGREEFACVLSPLDGAELALLAAEKLRRVVNAPLWLGEDEIYASPAIGIALLEGNTSGASVLLQQARCACLAAAAADDRILRYDHTLAAGTSRLVEAGKLRTAVADDALDLAFQPQFDLRFGQIMGMEGMLRWRDGGRALLPMRDVVAAAHAGGMLAKLMSSLLNRALRNCSEFRQRAGLDLRIVLNLPARALIEQALPDLVERALRTWSLRPGRLVLQIEGMQAAQARADARENVLRLNELGVKLALNDAGAPLSSLYWLADLPFKELRLDLGTGQDWLGKARVESVLAALVTLAHELKIDVLAAEVEDEAAAGRLQQLGCDYIQANFKGPALDPEDFVTRFAN